MCKSFSPPQSINASLMNMVFTLFVSWQNAPPEPLLVNLNNWWYDTSFLWLNSHEAWQCNGHCYMFTWSNWFNPCHLNTQRTIMEPSQAYMVPCWQLGSITSWSLGYNRNITWKLKKCWTDLQDEHLVSLALNVVDCDLSQFLPDVSDY